MIILATALLSFFCSQTLKIILFTIKKEPLTLNTILTPGGMPSTHSALVSGLTVSIAINQGIQSSDFAIGVTISIIAIYDAIGTRHLIGQHAKILNKNLPQNCPKLMIRVGHTPTEMAAGVVLGIAIALLLSLV